MLNTMQSPTMNTGVSVDVQKYISLNTVPVPEPPPLPGVSKYKPNSFNLQPKGKRFFKELQFKLVGAIESNNVSEVTKLIRKGVDVNCIILIHKTPLIYAIEKRTSDVRIFELLLKVGASVEIPEAVARSRRPIHVAVMTGSLEIVRKLLDYNAAVDGRDGSGMTALHYACFYGFQNIARELLLREPGHLMHCTDVTGRSAIHRAIERRHYDVAEMLIHNGGDIESVDQNGWTPLFQSIVFNDITSLKYLINRKINLNVRDVNGNTPLHVAANPLSREFIRVVSSTSMDYYKRTRRIPTAELQTLFMTQQIGCLKTVQILVNAGADVCAVNSSGAQPAHNTKVPEIMLYLLSCGCRLSADSLSILSQSVETELANQVGFSQAFLDQTRLSRQCRNIIRQCLGKTGDIHAAVTFLPLPQKIIDYIDLKTFDTERLPQ